MKWNRWWLCLIAVVLVGCSVTPYQPPQPIQPFVPTPQPAPVQPKPAPTQISVFEADFNKVQNGWTAAQVQETLGKPWRTAPPDQRGRTFWHYRVRLSDIEVDGEIEFTGTVVTGKVIF